MGFFPKPVELKYQTLRSKSAVIQSLNEIASFKGDNFKFPFRVIGNPLMVKSKLTAGNGLVTTDQNLTRVTAIILPTGQLKVAALIFTLMAIMPSIAAIGFIIEGKIFPFIGLLVIAMLFMSVPRILYFFAVQMRQYSIDHLILSGN